MMGRVKSMCKNRLLYLEVAKSGIGKNAKDMVILSKAGKLESAAPKVIVYD